MSRIKSMGVESLPGRARINLAPGHSLMDWIRLGQEKGDLSGVGPNKKRVTEEELVQHNAVDDMWMVIKGKVYNITPYVDFHPGGVDELMRAAGKDGTILFDEVHCWVNVESMLSKCLVGTLSAGRVSLGNIPRLSVSTVASESIKTPSYDWYQTDKEIKIVLYTRKPDFEANRIVIDVNTKEVYVEMQANQFSFFINFVPFAKLEPTCKVVAVKEKAEITFDKKVVQNWETLGSMKDLNFTHIKTSLAVTRFWHLTTVSNSLITHDTVLIGLKLPVGTRMLVPMGYHVIVYCMVEGMELARSYTVVTPCLLTEEQAATRKIPHPPTADNMLYLMIKCYKGGAISPLITAVKPGDSVKISRYDGNFEQRRFEGITNLIMFAAGTGFTSMIRPIRYILNTPSFSQVKVKLLFYNKTINDILWKDQLDTLCQLHKNFSVVYTLSMVIPEGWQGNVGRVTSDHIRTHVPKPSDKVKPFVLVCGQYAFNDMVSSFLKSHGLTDKYLHIFSSTS